MQKHRSDEHVSCQYITALILAALPAPLFVILHMAKSGAGHGLALRYGFSRFTLHVAMQTTPLREHVSLSIHIVSARTTVVTYDGCYPLPYGFAYLANFCVCFVANSLTVLTCTDREYHSSQTSNFIQIRKPFFRHHFLTRYINYNNTPQKQVLSLYTHISSESGVGECPDVPHFPRTFKAILLGMLYTTTYTTTHHKECILKGARYACPSTQATIPQYPTKCLTRQGFCDYVYSVHTALHHGLKQRKVPNDHRRKHSWCRHHHCDNDNFLTHGQHEKKRIPRAVNPPPK
jgi:hypothetical protein